MKEWLPAGTTIARYSISSRISANGIGEVYLANEMSSGIEVALKLLPASLARDDETRRRFAQVFSSAAQLRHPHFCQIYEGGIAENERPFVAMEYIKGQSFDMIGFGPQLLIQRIVSLVVQIAEALDGVHAQGLLHLAIKPSNLMATSAGQAKILDFGIGMVFPLSLSADAYEPLRATPASARYLSPEQVFGETPDQRSDVYSLGAVLYELIAGHPPIAGSSVDEVVAAVTLAQPLPLTQLREGVPAELDRIEDLIYFVKMYRQILLAIVLAVIGTAMAVFIVAQLWGDEAEPVVEERLAMRITRITENGNVRDVAISPDGKNLAFVSEEGSRQTLWLKELKSGREKRLASASGIDYRGLSFSPGGGSIYYVKASLGDDQGEACELPVSSGVDKVLFSTAGAIAASPDGERIALIGANDGRTETFLSIGSFDKAVGVVATRRNPRRFLSVNPAWSPDGRFVACAIKDDGDGLFVKITVIGVADGDERALVSGRWSEVDRIAWLADGRDLIVAASDPISGLSRLWRVAYPAGDVSLVTEDSLGYWGASPTADDLRMVSVQSTVMSNLWTASNIDGDQIARVSTDGFAGVNGLDWTPDDRIIYTSRSSGSETFWMSPQIGKRGGENRPLPIAPYGIEGRQHHPALSPNGDVLAFVAENAAGAYLWRSEVMQWSLKMLAEDRVALFPHFSPDGKWVVYSTVRGERGVVAKVASDGGATELLIEERAWRGIISPDGTRIACNYFDGASGRWKIGIIAFPAPSPISTFDAPGAMGRVLRWTPDGSGVAYVTTTGGVSNIRIQPVTGGQPAQVLNSRNDRIFNFAWSRDGKRVVFARGSALADVVLIQNFK
jgi:Tol biopolymer transport system component